MHLNMVLQIYFGKKKIENHLELTSVLSSFKHILFVCSILQLITASPCLACGLK